ncbi:TonB-dependent receptor [Oxalicibacterium solurbis]|uniref:TonB-dependent receptor n=1 Tax=Oxalicibacterium solurbis TaxID=69280 RepID=A0A8J3AYC5_9BURK|nr:TonB-dependent receptor [Oxalicibacterium solurbis]GGI54401.1 TonB-dependent receptor [Oxalicibacterium solurbis]
MSSRFRRSPIAIAAFLVAGGAFAQQPADTAVTTPEQTLGTIVVNASADASAEGLSKPYAGGQVARGGRIGILGTQDNMDVPFNVTSYTNELIQNQQARSVADVLRNDPSVRVARGFGNFQESYFIRGFLLGSDEVAYNGLYSLLPRQYVAAELFERVEVLKGASAFLTGASPGGGGVGGSINLLPKRAPNDPLTQVTVGGGIGTQGSVAADIARRFGPDGNTGVRLNAVRREGNTGVDDEKTELSVLALGVDWRSRDVRLSADIGHQDNKLKRARTNVTLGSGLTSVPTAPDNDSNWAQDWSYSNERDTFGTFRAEYDLSTDTTAWGAFGMRRSTEENSLANITVTDPITGDGNTRRADNYREDIVKSAEIGIRTKLRTGSVGHTLVASASTYYLSSENAYSWSPGGGISTNLYNPTKSARPATTTPVTSGGDMNDPNVTTRKQFNSIAVGDTLSFADDRVLLTLGVRQQKLDVRSYNYYTGEQNTGGSGGYDKSRISPVVGLVWKATDRLSAYANYIESLAQGAVAPMADGSRTVTNANTVFSPYVAKQKEIGVKYDAGRIGGGVAFFTTDKPSSLLTQTSPTTSVFSVNGEDRHQGVEFTVYGEATRNLKLLGGLTLLDAKQKKTSNGLTDGNKVIGVPDVQANIGLEWKVPGIQGLSLDSQIISTGRVYADNANTLRVPGWTRLDLGARYLSEIGGRLVTWRARINNATDKDYWASVGGYPGSGYLVLGTPRTVVVSATIDF